MPVQAVFVGDPVRHGLVYQVGCVTVVGRLLVLELVQKLVVFLVAFLARRIQDALTLEKLFAVDQPIGEGPHVEAEQAHVDLADVEQLFVEHADVPARELVCFVVGQPVGLDLLLAEPFRHDHRRRLQPQALSRHQAGMPGDDYAVPVGNDRLLPSKLPQRFRDLIDRGLVLSRVLLVGLDLIQRSFLDSHRAHSPFRTPRRMTS